MSYTTPHNKADRSNVGNSGDVGSTLGQPAFICDIKVDFHKSLYTSDNAHPLNCGSGTYDHISTWWRQQMETFSALLALCARNSPVTGEFPPQRPVTRSFDVFFHLCLNKRLSKQSWRWWFQTPSRPLWRHCNEMAPLRWRSLWIA